ncbi:MULTISPECIES: SDR family NAD(P)-dependent oxidoreductase [Actinosynnema]|uniref:SDR family NAD(P)-dependent oxidoreductase n=1 Tax=Actinosynnema TaxID=40566 RepID=UPI0020A47160|nr:SDR family oxidoreductase [Actinosynnema pretiosum]MCP2092184.1 NAD(P)-dependent dehydrogenase, short-chain alcohol dehydrogenase family [Actinosynnema pretiosum]
MAELEGKVALVTGGATGIGLAAATLFAAEGARVFITGRRQAELDAAAARIGATAIRGDVSDLADLDAIAARIAEAAGRLDVLFANAGGADTLATIAELRPESFDEVFGTNVRGAAFTVQKTLPLMPDGASIVVTGSTSASRGNPGFGTYSASKAALRQYARVWAAELAPRRIRVNVLVPGPTDTPGLRGIAGDPAGVPALLAQMAASTPLNRVADPAEIAQAALFLASDRSSFITGSELFADGGEVQVFPAA